MFKTAVFSAAAAILLCAAPMANADPFVTGGYAFGSPQTFGLSIGGSSVQAGGFAGTWNAQAITFWCIELTQYFSPGTTYTDYVPAAANDAVMALLGQLFNEAFPLAVTNAQYSAAFQLAIWEIVYDSGTGNLSLGPGGPGVFTVLSGDAGTVSIAQGWLNNLGSYGDTYGLVLLQSSDHQDFVTFGTPFLRVPEPASMALLAIALLAMIVVSRRRVSRSRR